MNNNLKGIVFSSLAFLSSFGMSEPLDGFNSLLEKFTVLEASFIQTTVSHEGESLETIYGAVTIERPNKFFWFTQPPIEQEIISDGSTLWVFDKDLEQVTRQNADEQFHRSPAVILSGQKDDLDNRYSIRERNADGEYRSFQLTPKDESESLSSILVVFKDEVISELRFEDQLGQTTLLELSQVQLDSELAPDFFNFEPPEGVDVLDQAN